MPKLYKKDDFKDNCGFGLIASINGLKSRKIITDSIKALVSMTHRGGIGSDGKTGDGCGLLIDLNKDDQVRVKAVNRVHCNGVFSRFSGFLVA